MRTRHSLISVITALLLVAGAAASNARSDGGLETINNPGGGQIVYGPLTMQCSLQVAFGTVLRAIHNRFGDKPQIGRLFQAKNSDSVAAFFKLTPSKQGSKPIVGLVIVSHPAEALPAAAMIYDDADRFSKTVVPMMKTLNEAWHPEPAATGGRSSASGGSNIAGAGAVQDLNPTPFPDGSGSIGLPAGWHITLARMGGVSADGPAGEAIHLGVIHTGIYDTSNPRVQARMAQVYRSGKPILACPANIDLFAAFRIISKQISQIKRIPEPTVTETSRTTQPSANGLSDLLVTGDMDFNDGKGVQSFKMRLSMIRPGALGQWGLCVNTILVPKSQAEKEWPTMTAIVSSWRQNGKMIQGVTDKTIGDIKRTGEIVDERIKATHAAEDAHNAAVYKRWDNQDKYSKSFQNYQLDQAVVENTATGEHRTLDYQGAATLVQANPDKYQYVDTPNFLKGIDY